MAKLTIGYWDIRGLAAPLRMICTYAGADFESVEYDVTGEPAWGKDKPGLKEKNAMINLPYILDGDRVITQSTACFLYLGRKFKIDGKTEEASCINDQVLCQAYDLRNDVVGHVYPFLGGKAEDAPELFSGKFAVHFTKFEEFLPDGQTYFCGSEPCTGDFHVWELIDQLVRLAAERGLPNPLDGKPKLKAMTQAMRAEPKLASYFEGRYYKLPMNNRMANFGNEKEPSFLVPVDSAARETNRQSEGRPTSEPSSPQAASGSSKTMADITSLECNPALQSSHRRGCSLVISTFPQHLALATPGLHQLHTLI
eukprot:CAMPEP_0170590778 /NCGR_PEP_ID=MMETSP0224-20130122/12050_1 /TAXON_ID=285029 /ORGANISM="Togula jolla, Strain CCCM 725" /LENGTH=310 /DNA_ID=CAMNT_0010914595 /DNA_START=46 /DNA_END=979 /DNA_ORIENTATION=+